MYISVQTVYMHMHVCMYVMFACMHACVHLVYVCRCVYLSMYVCDCMCMCVYVCAYTWVLISTTHGNYWRVTLVGMNENRSYVD